MHRISGVAWYEKALSKEMKEVILNLIGSIVGEQLVWKVGGRS